MINVKRYDIDYTKVVTERIPQELQVPEQVNWVYRLVSPLVYIFNQLILFRISILYKLSITPQVVYLEKMLNDRYDSSLRRIYIEDNNEKIQLFIFLRAELKPLYAYRKSELLTPSYMYRSGESSTISYDFIVFVPADLTFNENEMTSLINAYRLAGKYYSIQTF